MLRRLAVPQVLRPGQRLWCALGAIGLVALGGLVLTNPGPREFEEFAGQRLVELIEAEICDKPSLPLMLQMVLQDCNGLVHSQRQTLGRLAREHSTRLNLGVASVYRTSFGGQQLLEDLRLPHYNVTTLAAAGQFVVWTTSSRP
ncbi:MAG: hypothetical protein RLZZ336_1085 [Cyanobacteriota bacterium]|jgi:hypothetical protein